MDKLWLQQYQQGVPHEININEYPSLVAMFIETCDRFKDKEAYVNMGCALSFQEIEELTRDLGAYFQSLGLEKGARIAVMMPNLLQYPIAIFAILRAGYVVVNTNPLYTSDEVAYQLKDAGAEAIIILANFAKTLENALSRLPQLKHILITQIGDFFPSLKRHIVNFAVTHIKKMVPDYHLPQAISLRSAISKGNALPFAPVELNHNDIAFLQYTGGTTGVSKGAMLSHGNMVANVLQATAWIKPEGLGAQDIIVTALPLYHVFSLTANCLTFFKAGAKNILITNPRDIPNFIKEIKDLGFTAITGVNTLFNALLNHSHFKEIDFSKLKLALAGGMALQQSVSQRWREKTGSKVLEAYGLTETSPAVTINPLCLEDYNGSIGLPIPSTEISIRDDEGNEVPLGEKGELCVRGPQVMLGYWKKPEETEKVFWPDRFLRTGDIATVDKQGYVFLVDRKKDMILVSGFNVYPNEVEQVISMHPGVMEVGVIGVESEEFGEKVKACIVKKDEKLTKEEIVAHCRQHLTAYKVPKIVEFYNDLPKTNVGKILRRALK
ncbi:long-chain fatty-acid-CoA ligase (plasmid) [Legionella adelaidensis]|uniref:Long-chain-fatty-acid--CoA ligase n=1 Tax=Legionella adelaidensis TaxID=45056 RepID=A0A0W0R260_9GAMM|nr:AMP-binding protein [Legionella adelaidensis]KTC65114.1 long chain fatty acid-CoA ligase [Legionella adelaidensis]VEH85366.1 long-chain fatty-acid-CoA ligase [Legionella adelaidensis]